MALRLSRTSVTNIERGRQPIQLHTLYKIADIFGVEPTALLPGTSDAGTEQSSTSLRQNEWLQKISPQGDTNNASIQSKNPAARTTSKKST